MTEIDHLKETENLRRTKDEARLFEADFLEAPISFSQIE